MRSPTASVARVLSAAVASPRCSWTDASTTVGDVAHALVGHRARDLVVARERRRVRVVVAELGLGPDHRRRRHHLAPAVADVPEQLDGVVAAFDALACSSAPERDVREQHVHHADRPTVAGLAAFDRDVLGDRGGLVEPALVVANEREQSVGPAEAAPVAELSEEIGRLLEPVLGAAMLPCENEIHARFCSAHAAPRWLPDDRNEPSASETNRSACSRSPRKRWVMPSPRSTLAAPDSSSSSRQRCSASPNVASATSYAPIAASPSPSNVSAIASPVAVVGGARVRERGQRVVARRRARGGACGPGPDRGARSAGPSVFSGPSSASARS